LQREILAVWQTDEVRRQAPTPVDAATWGLAVIEQTGHQMLLENNPVLRRSINVRNPYVDPLN
jgi:phosphoenolpyruvate carboxylase